MKIQEMKVRLTLTEELLGTASNNKEIHSEFIASKAPDALKREEEVAAVGVEEVVEKSMTVFHRNAEGKPILFDYQIKGFFKNAAKAFYAQDKKSLPAYKSKIDNNVFIKERQLELHLPEGAEMGNCQRPLRAQTAQGERISLANSETVPAGTTIEMTIIWMIDGMDKKIKDWLDYGSFNGLGQWHNSGKGRFIWEEIG